jgi:acetylornithine/N-succinyldiaminopimelate aminotransferase
VLDVVLAPGFLDGVDRVARHLWRGMLASRPPPGGGGRRAGRGLLVGLKLRPEVSNADMQAAAVAEGLLTVAAGMNVLRLAPPLIIAEAEADEALECLDRACRRMTPGAIRAAAK